MTWADPGAWEAGERDEEGWREVGEAEEEEVEEVTELAAEGVAEELEEAAELLGWAALALGLAINVAFVALRWARRAGLDVEPRHLATALRLHASGNAALAVLALTHGAIMAPEATPLEYLLGLLVAVAVATGALMLAARGRRAKLVARAVHVQRALALALLALHLVHVVARG